MTSRHKKLDLDDAHAGMVLHDAVLDARGGVLLPRATTLTESMLTSLRRRGIDIIMVVDDAISEEELRAERERQQKRLARLFRKTGNAGANAALLQRMIEYRLGGAS
jgi:hypothetical protein